MPQVSTLLTSSPAPSCRPVKYSQGVSEMTTQQFIMITTNFLAELKNKANVEAQAAVSLITRNAAQAYASTGVKVAMQALQDQATQAFTDADTQYQAAFTAASTATNTTGAAQQALEAAILAMQQTGAVEQT